MEFFRPTVQNFREYFGKVFDSKTDYPDGMIQAQLDESSLVVHQCVFGKYYKRALYYLTAHYVVILTQLNQKAQIAPAGSTAVSAPLGVVSSTSVGDLSLSKEMPEYTKGSDDKYLASTVFGQEFIMLRNKMSRGALLANQVPGNNGRFC